MKRTLGVIAALCCITQAAAQTSNEGARFSVAGADFRFRLPDGFCPPTDDLAELNARMVAADTSSETLVSAYPCGAKIVANQPPPYPLWIRSLHGTETFNLDRASFLSRASAILGSAEFNREINSGTLKDQIQKEVDQNLGIHVEANRAMRPLGRDDVCAYVQGITTGTAAGRSFTRASMNCFTTVKNQLLSIVTFAPYESPETLSTLLDRVRSVAKSLIAQNETANP